MKVNIIGSGLAGATSARLLHDSGHIVTVFESRPHIGGNCYDSYLNGTLVHNYGPHIFHTDDEEVFEFLSKYTEWEPFELKIKGITNLGKISLPYSKKTVCELGRELSQEEIIDSIFKDYSEKQWGVDFENIPKSITNRIPKTKDCDDPTWFNGQKYQCIPKNGYTEMFKNILNGIHVKLNCHIDDWKNEQADLIIYTGKIDDYFDNCYGELPYRTLDFIHKTSKVKMSEVIQNQNNKSVTYTRSYDHSYFTPNHRGMTIITEEYPRNYENGDIPYYPIPFGDGISTYSKYKKLADKEKNIIFIGRLATYTYMDMWMVVKQAMLKLKNL
jgi:UDP-galactopyranose mutase